MDNFFNEKVYTARIGSQSISTVRRTLARNGMYVQIDDDHYALRIIFTRVKDRQRKGKKETFFTLTGLDLSKKSEYKLIHEGYLRDIEDLDLKGKIGDLLKKKGGKNAK